MDDEQREQAPGLAHRILWVKSVTDIAYRVPIVYVGRDPRTRNRYRDPKSTGESFDLHCSAEASKSLDRPEHGDIVVLTQLGLATHLIEITGPKVVPRHPGSILPGSNDARYCFQRECRVLAIHADGAPKTRRVFGFDPNSEGGHVHRIDELLAYKKSGLCLSDLQESIASALCS